MNQNDEIIDTYVSDSCVSLFTDYALPLVRVHDVRPDFAEPLLFCGVMGFGGDQMRGSLLLATSREPLGRTSPSNDASLREWIAELSNQLLGRIKSKLLPHNVALHLSTPLVLRGEHISPIEQGALRPFAFTCEGGHVIVWFDAEVQPGVDLTQHVEEEVGLAEGTGMLF